MLLWNFSKSMYLLVIVTKGFEITLQKIAIILHPREL